MGVSVVIPARNEEDVIFQTVTAALAIPLVEEVTVIDDGSTDHTVEEAIRAGASVFSHKTPLGKGQALTTGARSARGEIILFLDADLGSSAREAFALVEPVLRGKARITVGHWVNKSPGGGFGLTVMLSRLSLKLFTRKTLRSPLCGQRALARSALGDLMPFAGGFGAEIGMTIDALRSGLPLLEVPVNMEHRNYGLTARGFMHRGRQFLHVFLTVAGRIIRHLRTGSNWRLKAFGEEK